MVDSRKRATASLKVKYKSATLAQFTQQFGLDISHAGMFIKTKAPLEPGVLLRLELQLSDATPVIQGSGRVKWRRLPGPDVALPAGMGIEFIRLEASSRSLVDGIVDARDGRPSRFEQTEGAAQLGASQPLVSSFGSLPPATAASLPPILPSPAPAMPPPDSEPPPSAAAVVAAPVGQPHPPGLFANSGLRSGPTTIQPVTDFGTQSSFFTGRAGDPPAPAPVGRAASDAAAIPRREREDEITSRFGEPKRRDASADESEVTHPLALSTLDAVAPDPLDDDHALSAQLAPVSDDEPLQQPAFDQTPEADVDSAPVSVLPQLQLGLSSLQPPPRSRTTAVVWLVVVALALGAIGLAFFYLRHSSAPPKEPRVEAAAT